MSDILLFLGGVGLVFGIAMILNFYYGRKRPEVAPDPNQARAAADVENDAGVSS